MKGCFIRCLFGDKFVDGYDGLMSHDLPLRAKDAIKPEPCVWVAFGTENADLIRSAGFMPLLASEEAIPGGNGREPDYETQFGAARYGRNIYSLKFEAVKAAMLCGYDHAVFLDLDVEQIVSLDSVPSGDFWEDLEMGKPIQAPLVQYHQTQCPWRTHHRRTSIYCATAYFRGLRTVERCLELARQHPQDFEQAAMNRAIDELAGGEFPGIAEYQEAGFEFPFTEQRGGMIHAPVYAVFRIGSKGWSEWKRKGIAAWREHVAKLLCFHPSN